MDPPFLATQPRCLVDLSHLGSNLLEEGSIKHNFLCEEIEEIVADVNAVVDTLLLVFFPLAGDQRVHSVLMLWI